MHVLPTLFLHRALCMGYLSLHVSASFLHLKLLPSSFNEEQIPKANSCCVCQINSRSVKQRRHTSCPCSLPSGQNLRRSTGVLKHCISFCSVFLFCSMCKTGKQQNLLFCYFSFCVQRKVNIGKKDELEY